VTRVNDPFRISLAMIVRDEARCLQRCLDSVRDVVDEMVVVDTGSVDATVEIATAAGAQVHHVALVDDFAAARNAGLERCTGDWVLVMDADEVLASGADVVRRLRRVAPEFAGVIEVESETNDGQVSLSQQDRIFPAAVRYAGAVHEQPTGDWPRRAMAVRLAHDGYLPAQLARKGDRNQRLLEAELRKRPADPYLHLQLGRAHEALEQHEDACGYYLRSYELTGPTGDGSPHWRHDLVVRLLYALGQSGRIQEAVDVAETEFAHWKHSADFHFELGHVLLKHALGNPQAAGDLLPLIESSWQHCLELGDTMALTGAIRGKGSHLAAQNLVMFYETQGLTAQADRYRSLVRPAR
jgi:glycosyltransferase involved in cell wall biosynthesis